MGQGEDGLEFDAELDVGVDIEDVFGQPVDG